MSAEIVDTAGGILTPLRHLAGAVLAISLEKAEKKGSL